MHPQVFQEKLGPFLCSENSVTKKVLDIPSVGLYSHN